MSDIYASPDSVVADSNAADEFTATAIGPKNTQYYLDYFERLGDRPWGASWNWPAFFVTSLWLLYRKMWAGFFFYILAIPTILLIVSGALGAVVNETLAIVFYYAGSAVAGFGFPVIANALYKRKVAALVRKSEMHAGEADRLAWLQRHGGTSFIWLVLLAIPLIGILAAVGLPAYQDYMENAQRAVSP